jgi:hypothetical protein
LAASLSSSLRNPGSVKRTRVGGVERFLISILLR